MTSINPFKLRKIIGRNTNKISKLDAVILVIGAFSIIIIGGKFIDLIINEYYPDSLLYAIIIDFITLFPAIIILGIIWQRAIIKKYNLNEQ